MATNFERTPDGKWFITRPNSSKFPCFASKEMEIAYQLGVRDATEKIREDVLEIEADFHGGDFHIDEWLKKYRRGTRLREALVSYFTQGEG